MTLHQLITFNIALFVALASPGPGMLMALRTSLTGGLRPGLAVGFGLGSMACGWTLAALLGLHGLFQLFPWAFTAVKMVGALYLLYIAWALWVHARVPLQIGDISTRHAFLRGVLVNLTNPKSVLFAAAVLLAIFPDPLTPAQSAFIVLNHAAMEWSFYALMAFGLHRAANMERLLSYKLYLDRAAGFVMGGLGARLLLGR